MKVYLEFKKEKAILGKDPPAPNDMEMAEKDWVAEEDQMSPVDKFFEDYEITDNAEDYVLA